MTSRGHEVLRFALVLVVAHTLTYFVVGMLAYTVLDYPALFARPPLDAFMRPVDSPAVRMGILFQPPRALLFALVLWPVRDALRGPLGWLRLWGLLAGIGILGTFGPTLGSLEGLVYMSVPAATQLILLPEILTQTLLLSICTWQFALRETGSSTSSRSARLRVIGLAVALWFGGLLAMIASGAAASSILGLGAAELSRLPSAGPVALATMAAHLLVAIPLSRLGGRSPSLLRAALLLVGVELAIPVVARLLIADDTVPLGLSLASGLLSAVLLWVIFALFSRSRLAAAPEAVI